MLDIACGEGYGTALIGQTARSVIGVDVSAETVDHARAHHAKGGVSFLLGDARSIPILDASVDAVVSFETIEHFYEHDAFIAEVRRVLRPGGLFIVSSPDRDVYSPTGASANPYHVRELTRLEFESLLLGTFSNMVMLARIMHQGDGVDHGGRWRAASFRPA